MKIRGRLVLVWSVFGLLGATYPAAESPSPGSAPARAETSPGAPPLPPPPPARVRPRAPAATAGATNPAVIPAPVPGPGAAAAGPVLALVADADVKEYTAKPGETNANFTFNLANSSPVAVTVSEVKTSCGCTVAKLPRTPWVLVPGTNGDVHVSVDLRGKHGQVTKLVYVNGPTGTKTLTVKVNIPKMMSGSREQNQQIATADRQAVFKSDCAHCHAEPAAGRTGEALYAVACGICHESEHRASMVPDLRRLNHSTDRIYWRVWASQGKMGTLMPGFARAAGGPLTEAQIDSLADYLAETIPTRPVAAAP